MKGDGHCLPHAVFRGDKYHNLLPGYIKYLSLLKEAVDQIELNIKQYAGMLTEREEVAKNVLEKFVAKKNYNVESNIVDTIINEMEKIRSCIIIVHYQWWRIVWPPCIPSYVPPTARHPCIKLAFINTHFDLMKSTSSNQRSLPHQISS